MSVGIIEGNAFGVYNMQISITPTAVGGATAAEQTFTFPGLRTTDSPIDITPTVVTAGVYAVNSRVSAANTLAITFVNPSAGSLTPAAGTYYFTILRPSSGLAATAIGA